MIATTNMTVVRAGQRPNPRPPPAGGPLCSGSHDGGSLAGNDSCDDSSIGSGGCVIRYSLLQATADSRQPTVDVCR
jgi:hypothetical protein